MKDVTISYSIERAAGGFLVGADYFDETYTLPSRVSLDTPVSYTHLTLPTS